MPGSQSGSQSAAKVSCLPWFISCSRLCIGDFQPLRNQIPGLTSIHPQVGQDDTLRPVTIKQLIDSQQPYAEAPFRIDNVEVGQVSFVAQIRAVNAQATNITYKLEDGTGVLEVKKWIDPGQAGGGNEYDDDDMMGGGADRGPNLPMEVGNFVRVYGRLKALNNKRLVTAHVIRAVQDYNEVSYHLLEAAYVHLLLTRGPLDGQGGVGAGGDHGGDSMFVDGGDQGGGQAGGNSGNNAKVMGCTIPAQKVFNFIQNQPGGQEGVGLSTIAGGAGLSNREVLGAADELVNKGLLYTTVDDETWAILDY